MYYNTFYDADGTLNAWIPTTPMPFTLAEHQVLFAGGRFYLMGGSRDNIGSSLQNAVFYCIPDPLTGGIPGPGLYGTWELSNTLLEQGVAGHQCVQNNGVLYVLGGRYNNVPHSSSAYLNRVADIQLRSYQTYAQVGAFERYVDFDRDTYVENITWQGNPNGEIVRFRARFALEKGEWSDWTPEYLVAPLPVERAARYVHYKLELETANNIPPTARTPLIDEVIINYAGGKKIELDGVRVNHNSFDPQIEDLQVSYVTRDHNVSSVVLRIYNLEGELIRRHQIDIPAADPLPATGMWSWDGTNENGELVANGVYVVQYNSGNTHKIRKVLVLKR